MNVPERPPATYREVWLIAERLRAAAAAVIQVGEAEWRRRFEVAGSGWDADRERGRPWARHLLRVRERMDGKIATAQALLDRPDVRTTLKVRPRFAATQVVRSWLHAYRTTGNERFYAREEVRPTEKALSDAAVPFEVARLEDGWAVTAACEPWEARALRDRLPLVQVLRSYSRTANVLVLHPTLRMLPHEALCLLKREAGRLI